MKCLTWVVTPLGALMQWSRQCRGTCEVESWGFFDGWMVFAYLLWFPFFVDLFWDTHMRIHTHTRRERERQRAQTWWVGKWGGSGKARGRGHKIYCMKIYIKKSKTREKCVKHLRFPLLWKKKNSSQTFKGIDQGHWSSWWTLGLFFLKNMEY